jgi:hypothetical protein
MVERRRWQCPQCGRKWEIPIGHDPTGCPRCEHGTSESSAAEAGERDFQAFFSRFAVETSRRTSLSKPVDGAAREEKAQSLAGAEPFFIPLSTESSDTHAAPMRNPLAGRRRKQRGGFPIAVAVACVASCLLLGGLIAYQKSTTKSAIANAPRVQNAAPKPGAATKIEVVRDVGPGIVPGAALKNRPKSEPFRPTLDGDAPISPVATAEPSESGNATHEQSAISLAEFDSLFGRETEENEFVQLTLPQLMQQETKPGRRAQMKRIERRDLERNNKWKEIRGKRVTWRGSVDFVTTINGRRGVCFGASGGSKLQIAIQLRSDRVAENLHTGDQVTYNGVLDSIVNLGLGMHLNIADGVIIDLHR